MNLRKYSAALGLAAGATLLLTLDVVAAARITADIVPPPRRQSVLETAEKLAQREPVKPLPADLPSPFNPAGFDKPEPAEVSPAAPKGAPPPGESPLPSGGVAGGGTPAPAKPAVPSTDRETLEMLAAQITPSGVIERGGRPRLVFANRFFEVGTRFTASYNSQDYELELVAIDRTTFTLRYRGEEITRPIKPVR
jgi:hypothetical protein